MKQLKESRTQTIKRSQIKLNPFNPKRHTDDKIRFQKRNLEKVGFLGGIVWNELSGNLIDGHRRIMAMDMHYGYDGTDQTDYDVKVEVVSLDEKEEKNQMTYMAIGDTQADFNLISRYVDEIDYKSAGLSKEEYDKIQAIAESVSDEVATSITTLDDIIAPPDTSDPSGTKEQIKAKKEQIKAKKDKSRYDSYARQNDEDAFITVCFSNFEGKVAFCEMFGCDPYNTKFINGEDLFSKLNDMQ